ncbi:hypothetical protein HMN09_00935000 [Mycena chlorophos]|uniref:Uncharacterized protein n=1 Tax=Mycena chlorophos TaxID=658473 RepID=A0A8H6SMF4_MYCCL|nr:hypothetical protein HMN09_00935000 [Mycena chlorophos]
MPHKRAKRSVRESQRNEKGIDNAPSKTQSGDALSSEPLPKSFARAINAAQVRADYKKRKLADAEDDGSKDKGAKRRKTTKEGDSDMRIRPGETLAHFNKRIEGDMRPVVKSAIQSSRATVRAQKKVEAAGKGQGHKPAGKKASSEDEDDEKPTRKPPSTNAAPKSTLPVVAATPKATEFQVASTSAPRRLNDIAQAPPDLSALVRKAQKRAGGGKVGVGKEKAKDAVSPAQQLLLAQAREEAIQRYRQMKADKLAKDNV